MEALLSTLAFRRVPTVERTKKRRKEEQDAEQVSRKRPKLLEDILSGENPPTLVPSYTSKGVQCKLAIFCRNQYEQGRIRGCFRRAAILRNP